MILRQLVTRIVSTCDRLWHIARRQSLLEEWEFIGICNEHMSLLVKAIRGTMRIERNSRQHSGSSQFHEAVRKTSGLFPKSGYNLLQLLAFELDP